MITSEVRTPVQGGVNIYNRIATAMRPVTLNPELLAYCAGVVDSDGFFSIKKSSNRARNQGDAINYLYHARVGVKQVLPGAAILLLRDTFGGSLSTQKPNAVHGKPLVGWQVTDRLAEKTTILLLPYLRIKAKQANLLLRLRSTQAEGRLGVVVKIHNDRWGKKQSFNNRCYSDDQIKRMDSLYIGIRNLNDTRWVNQPKPLEGVKA